MRTRHFVVFSATLAAALAAAPSFAQNALGDGTALDGNLNVEGTRNVGSPGQNYQLRNLLVTQNVAGGRGFRGTIGYRAAEDFRGATGSDDLYTFRADSALSSLNYINIGRDTRAIGLGQDIGLIEFRRESTGTTLPTLGQHLPQAEPMDAYGELLDARLRLDRSLLDYQSSGRLLEAGATPGPIAYFSTEDGEVLQLTASTLRGLRTSALSQDPAALGLTLYDQARMLDQALASGEITPAGMPFDMDVRRILDAQAAATTQGGFESTLPQAYRELVQDIAGRSGGDMTTDQGATQLREQMQRTSQWLRGEGMGEDEQGATTAPLQPRLPGVTPPQGEGEGEGESGETAPRNLLDPRGAPVRGAEREAVRMPEGVTVDMLRHGRTIDSLATDGDEHFTEIMRQGQQQLARGEYFLAERQFVRALGYTPGHPMAVAGLANAQLGAGILGSTPVTLRNLFVNHPEMIDAQYAAGLLPPNERLMKTAEVLRNRLAGERPSSGSGLMLAYIGRQLGDQDMIREGLDAMTELDVSDPLVPVLRMIWLNAQPPASPGGENGGGAEQPGN